MFYHHRITCLNEEANYLAIELNLQLPLPFVSVSTVEEYTIPRGKSVRIKTNDPLTLEQRRFLTGCGFQFSTSVYEGEK